MTTVVGSLQSHFPITLSVQPVDATSPDINLSSKVTFMKQRRWKLSSAQRADKWNRW